MGDEGRVLALDIDQEALDINAHLADARGITNVETRLVPYDDPGLAPGEADLIFISHAWHLLPDQFRYAATLRASMREGTSLAVIGNGKDSRPDRTDRYQVIRDAEAGGFVLAQEHDFLKQFFVVFVPGHSDILSELYGFDYVTGELALGGHIFER